VLSALGWPAFLRKSTTSSRDTGVSGARTCLAQNNVSVCRIFLGIVASGLTRGVILRTILSPSLVSQSSPNFSKSTSYCFSRAYAPNNRRALIRADDRLIKRQPNIQRYMRAAPSKKSASPGGPRFAAKSTRPNFTKKGKQRLQESRAQSRAEIFL
jgi:hypothetical protein